MDIEKIETEIDAILDAIGDEDEQTKEYAASINSAQKLQQIAMSEREFENKKERQVFDEEIRRAQIDIEKKKLKLESRRIDNQHEERMKEIEVDKIKAENEKMSLEQNQIKAEREFKNKKRNDILIFGAKVIIGGLLVGAQILMHKDELDFERNENGITPSRCKVYNSVVGRAAENIMR